LNWPQSIDEQTVYTATKEKRCKSNRTHRHRCRQRNLSSRASSDYGGTATAPGATHACFGLVALIVVLIALVVANTRQVKLSWVVGSGHASLVWIILATAVLGWVLGMLTSVVFRLRTRRRRSA
jgi:uncharacterized integral membrane protein